MLFNKTYKAKFTVNDNAHWSSFVIVHLPFWKTEEQVLAKALHKARSYYDFDDGYVIKITSIRRLGIFEATLCF